MPTPLVGYGEGCRSVEHYAFLNTNDTHTRKQNRRYHHNAPDEETTSACGTVLRTRAVSATGSIELLGVKSRLRIECNIYYSFCNVRTAL